MRDKDLKRSWLNFVLLNNTLAIYESKACAAAFILLASGMRREEIGEEPIEHEVQLQNDDHLKLIIKRKPFSGFDPVRSNRLSDLKDAPLFATVAANQDKRIQAFVSENGTHESASHADLYRQNAKLSRPKRKFESVGDVEQPQKKFCNGLSYKVKPKAAVDKMRSNPDTFNIRPYKKYSVRKQSLKERFLGHAVGDPRTLLLESSHVDATPVRSLIGEGRDQSFGFMIADDSRKCSVAIERLQTGDDDNVVPWDSFSTKVKPVPLWRLERVSELSSSYLPTNVDKARNESALKVLPATLAHPRAVQSTALTLRQQKATKSTNPLPQHQAIRSTDTTLCQQQPNSSNPFHSLTSKTLQSYGQCQTTLATDATLYQSRTTLPIGTSLCQRQTALATDATLCQRQTTLATDTTSCQRQTTLATATDRGVQIEPRLLGPCEPGTHIQLESTILALDEKGHLVISASWRGKTLSGFLMEVKPGSGWGFQHERLPEPQPSGGRLDRKCKRNVTYAVKHKRRRAKKVAAQEEGMPTEEQDRCQETERDNEQWQHLTDEEYVTCPMPECFKKFVNEIALRYHLTSGHRQKDDSSKSCRPGFKKGELTVSDRGQRDDVACILNRKKRVLEGGESGRNDSREAHISERVVPVPNSLTSSGKDGVKVTELTPAALTFSTSLGTLPRLRAQLDNVPNVSTFKDALLPRFVYSKVGPKCGTSVDLVPEFSTSLDTKPKFFLPQKPEPCANSEPQSSFKDRPSAKSSSPVLHHTPNIPASLSASDELHRITDTPDSAIVGGHELYALTIVAASSDAGPLRSPAQSVSKCAADDTFQRPEDTKFTSDSVCAAVSEGYLYAQLDDTDSTSTASVFDASLVGDLATLSFGDEYKSLGVGGSILGPELNDLLFFNGTDSRLSAVDCCAMSDAASGSGRTSSISERMLISAETASTSPIDDSIMTSSVNFELSSGYDSKMSFMCNKKANLAENSQFLLGECENGLSGITTFLTVPVDKTDKAENSRCSSLKENSRSFVDTVGSSGNAELSVCESTGVSFDAEKFSSDSQQLLPSRNLAVCTKSEVDLAKNSSVMSVNEHVETSSGDNHTEKTELSEKLHFPSRHNYPTHVSDTFDLPDVSQAFSANENLHASSSSANENLRVSSVIENLQAFTLMENLQSSSFSENLQVDPLDFNLQASSVSEALHASGSDENYSGMFDEYLFPSAGVTATEDEACSLSEKASVGGHLNTNSPICFSAEVPSIVNEAHIHCLTTENDLTLASSGFNEAKLEKSRNANDDYVNIPVSHSGYSTLCYEPVSPASSGVSSPTYQGFSVDPHSTRVPSLSEFASTEADIGELPIDQITVLSSAPPCRPEPPTNAVQTSKIIYDLSDISDPEDDAPTSTRFNPNCPAQPWFPMGENGYSLSMLPSGTNYSRTNLCGPSYNYSTGSSSGAGPCFEGVSGGNANDALVGRIVGTDGLSQSSGSAEMMLDRWPQSLQVRDPDGNTRSASSTFVQNETSECRSENLASSSLSKLDISDTGPIVSVLGAQNFQSNFEDFDSPLRQAESWSNMFYTNRRLCEHPSDEQYVKVLHSKDDYSGLIQGYNSASIVCDKYSEFAGSVDRISGSLSHPDSTDFASLPDSVNGDLHAPNVSGLDSFLDDLQGTSVKNAQRETTTSDKLTFASSRDARR